MLDVHWLLYISVYRRIKYVTEIYLNLGSSISKTLNVMRGTITWEELH